MIASLAMYDLPWLHAANDQLWALIAAGLRARGIADVPETLTRGRELDGIWLSPDLLVAQSCGYPLTTRLRGQVQLVATPHYDAEGCEGAFHRAAIVVRADNPAASLAELHGARVGINDWHSNTGMNLLRAAVAPLAGGAAFFGEVVVTGSHAQSIAALTEGRIDVASIDAVTLVHILSHDPEQAHAIRILDWTATTPGLPLITSASTPPETVAALRDVLSSLTPDPSLEALRITGFETIAVEAYDAVLRLERQAESLDYPTLR
jgi:ABC-type phosphate/phosphonate transport system substrate-binding protein